MILINCSLIRKIIFIIFITTAFNAFCLLVILVPLIKNETFSLEEKNGKLQLEKVASLVNKTYNELEDYKKLALENRKNYLKNLTFVAETFINHVYESYKKGEFEGEEEAKLTVLNTVKDLRYGNKDYFFISDYNNILISHPDLMYEDFSTKKDVYGNLIVPPMVEKARKFNEGFHSYWWNRLDRKEPSEKLTYSKHFPQWQWVLGTGVYVDDIDEEVAKRKEKLFDELRNILKDLKIGKTGYLYIFDSNFKMIIHPNKKLEGKNFASLKTPGSNLNIGEELVKASKTTGVYYYKWDKPEDPDNFAYKKVSWIIYFEPLDIYICSSAYLSEIEVTSEKIRISIIAISLFTFLISFIITFLVVKNILKPIKILSNNARKIREGDLSARSNIKPYDESGFISTEDEISILSAEFDNMIHSFQDSQKELIMLNETLEQKIDERTLELNIKTQKIETLLHNSGVGFLSFGEDLLIDSEYSVECETIFEKKIGGLMIADIMLPENTTSRNQFISNLQKIFSETTDIFRKEVFINLLPKTFKIDHKIVSVGYKLLDNNKMMFVLNDITYETELKDKIKEEKERLKFIVGFIKDKSFIFEILDDFLNFRNNEFNELLKSQRPLNEILPIIYRKIHTFKGLFMQFGFIHLSDALHESENIMQDIISEKRENIPESLKNIWQISNCDNSYIKDMEIIIKNLGREFLEDSEKIKVKKDEIINILEITSPEELKSSIKKLLFENIKFLLTPYIRHLTSLAFRFGKEIEQFDISGDDILVNKDIYSPFIRSLIHIFRNIIDHGIETPEIRNKKGKSSAGNISCDVYLKDNSILITISDDGQGIDLDRIKKKAVELGFYDKTTIDLMADKDIISLILKDSFSTKEKTDQLSGRGVGLAAVMEELTRLGGSLDIKTQKDNGTVFVFTIPYIEKK